MKLTLQLVSSACDLLLELVDLTRRLLTELLELVFDRVGWGLLGVEWSHHEQEDLVLLRIRLAAHVQGLVADKFKLRFGQLDVLFLVHFGKGVAHDGNQHVEHGDLHKEACQYEEGHEEPRQSTIFIAVDGVLADRHQELIHCLGHRRSNKSMLLVYG